METTIFHEAKSVTELYAEGRRYFMGEGSLHNSLAQIASDLKAHDIDYMVIEAVALMVHGYRRFTEDIDSLDCKLDPKQMIRKVEEYL